MTDAVTTTTARGASFLILLQIASRALTFIVNQILLRFLTPEILGVAAQLELLSISTLYFARESIRVALQRESGNSRKQKNAEAKEDGKAKSEAEWRGRRVQEAINLSWTAIGLGLILTLFFERLYLDRADAAVLRTPKIRTSLHIYSLATFIELLNEPAFAVAQQQMLYGVRASSEMRATFTRCLAASTVAGVAKKTGVDVGVLPFAIGQLAYALVLNVSYFRQVSVVFSKFSMSRMPIGVGETGDFIPRPLFLMACELYGQSLFKQLLTSGDQYMVATLTDLSSQGSYALASNYGGLIARVLFQPIEESSRALFARLLPPSTDMHTTKGREDHHSEVFEASIYLGRILHAYTLLAIGVVIFGMRLVRPLLHFVAGATWSGTDAHSVLELYCFYIPLLSFNGILEAFVAATATPAQLRVQSLWMAGFSFLFACVSFILIGRWKGGVHGLIIANIMTMAGRTIWSLFFVQNELRSRGGSLKYKRLWISGMTSLSTVLSVCFFAFTNPLNDPLAECIRVGSAAIIWSLSTFVSKRSTPR